MSEKKSKAKRSEREGRIVDTAALEISTGSVKLAVMGANRKSVDLENVKMEGATLLFGEPAFDLDYLPALVLRAMEALEKRGWIFGKVKKFSTAVRQHDLVLLDHDGDLLCPALSWEFGKKKGSTVGDKEVAELYDLGINKEVGRIEKRFVMPKLKWLLKQDSSLRKKIFTVMTLDGAIAKKLTGISHLSSSEALSNGLLNQKTREKSVMEFEKAGFNPFWFPKIVQSGQFVFVISALNDFVGAWKEVAKKLKGAKLYAGLGDNHATAVGVGLRDKNTIPVSIGTSGTVTEMVEFFWKLAGQMACFEYYDKRLLLGMLDDCSSWYNEFVKNDGEGKTHAELDALAEEAINSGTFIRIKDRESYPDYWKEVSLPVKIASVQGSIALQMLLILKKMLCEVIDERAEKTNKVALTGGGSQSPFFKKVFNVGLRKISRAVLHIGDAPGKFVHDTAALGALINARAAGNMTALFGLMDDICPTKRFVAPDSDKKLKAFLGNSFSEMLEAE